MPLKEVYLPEGEVLVNYDFADILSNVGYVTFYGIMDEADDYFLTRSAVDCGHSNERTYNYAAGGVYTWTEVDYDFEFPTHQHVKGNMFVTSCHHVHVPGGDGGVGYIKCRVYHYDGSTETEIGTQQSTSVLGGSAGEFYFRTTFTFDGIDQIFKVGDILRVNFEIGANSANVAMYTALFNDPANKDYGQEDPAATSVGSNLIVQVPFNLGGKI